MRILLNPERRVAAASEEKRSLPMVLDNTREPSASWRLPLPPGTVP